MAGTESVILRVPVSRGPAKDIRDPYLKSKSMARITVEDCLKKIDNQFNLVMTAAKRARRIANGADPLVELENDKPTVVALREIAAGVMNADVLDELEAKERAAEEFELAAEFAALEQPPTDPI